MQQEVYRIEELAEASGVSIRNIRYYTAEGLLPPPDARGRYALYTEEHVQRLRLIQQWKEAFFPLEVIRARLQELTAPQVAELLTAPVGEGQAASLPPQAPASSQTPGSAADYIRRVLARRSTVTPPSDDTAAPAGMPAPAPVAASKKAASIDAIEKETPLAAPLPDETVSAEAWHRVPLASGVELHVRQVDDRVRQLITFARNLFRSDS